tara:strand:- start:54 stop:230 length:177 start_codon:yes stop_codon:yes gene_type:complete
MLKLNLGCADRRIEGFTGVDIAPGPAARETMQGFSGMPGLPDSKEALKARTDALRAKP